METPVGSLFAVQKRWRNGLALRRQRELAQRRHPLRRSRLRRAGAAAADGQDPSESGSPSSRLPEATDHKVHTRFLCPSTGATTVRDGSRSDLAPEVPVIDKPLAVQYSRG